MLTLGIDPGFTAALAQLHRPSDPNEVAAEISWPPARDTAVALRLAPDAVINIIGRRCSRRTGRWQHACPASLCSAIRLTARESHEESKGDAIKYGAHERCQECPVEDREGEHRRCLRAPRWYCRMTEWAKENRTEFYRLYCKLIPTEVSGPDGSVLNFALLVPPNVP